MAVNSDFLSFFFFHSWDLGFDFAEMQNIFWMLSSLTTLKDTMPCETKALHHVECLYLNCYVP